MVCALDMGKVLQIKFATFHMSCGLLLVHADHVFPLAMLVLLNNVGIVIGLYKFEAVLGLLS